MPPLSGTPARCRFLAACCLVFSVVLVVGCGPDYKARAVVKGKVRLGKQNLNWGTVTFHGPHNIISSAPIDENGDYEMKDAPVGEVKITVAVDPPGGGGMLAKKESEAWKKAAGKTESKDPDGGNPGIALMPKVPANVVRIDAKYAKPETSGLIYKVEKGEHTKDIDL